MPAPVPARAERFRKLGAEASARGPISRQHDAGWPQLSASVSLASVQNGRPGCLHLAVSAVATSVARPAEGPFTWRLGPGGALAMPKHEDRSGSPPLGEERVRVGKVRTMKWIEPLGETLRIAGLRFGQLGSFTVIGHFPRKGRSTLLWHDALVPPSDRSGSGLRAGHARHDLILTRAIASTSF